MLKVSTFCSGIGSPEMALKNLGIEHEVIMTAEIDKYARQTYLANHSTKKMINDMTEPNYEGDEYYADINISGLPCQSFSLAGKRLGELDPRGLLFFDFLRYVKNQQPKYFIIENVKGLLSDNGGETFQNWIHLLGQSVNGNAFFFPHEDSLMYNLHWQVLNTKDYGLPQNRERVFLVGIRNDLPNTFVFPKGVPLKLRLKDILEEVVDEKYYLSDKMLNYLNSNTEKQQSNGNGFKFTPTDGNVISKAITTKEGSRMDDNFIKVAIGAMRGRNPDNPNDRSKGGNYQQTLEINENGTSNCLSTVQKDNLVIQMNPSLESGGKQPYQQNRVYDSNGITPALMAGKSDLNIQVQKDNLVVYNGIGVHPNSKKLEFNGFHDTVSPTLLATDYKAPKCIQYSDFRIRKLTPLECFRLQGFPDDFKKPVSNSQLYKQAGNTISVNVIQAILKNLLPV